MDMASGGGISRFLELTEDYLKHDVVIYGNDMYIATGNVPAGLAPDTDVANTMITGSSSYTDQNGSLRTQANAVAGTPSIESWNGDHTGFNVNQWMLLTVDPATCHIR